VKGDLFAEDGHLVIGTCDTFDTSIPDIIERSSVQGIALDRLYGNAIDKLDADLAAALQSVRPIGRLRRKARLHGIRWGPSRSLIGLRENSSSLDTRRWTKTTMPRALRTGCGPV